MYMDHYDSPHPVSNQQISLHLIYRVLADHTYQVSHLPCSCGSMVFVYTDYGIGRLQCPEGEFILSPQTGLLFSADTPFFYETYKEQWNFWWFEFSGTPSCEKGVLYFFRDCSWIETLCEHSLESLRKGTSFAPSYLSCIQSFAADSMRKDRDPDRERFLFAREIIQKKLCRTNVSSLAGELCMDPRSLYNLFIRYAGCPPKAYLRDYVMDTAKYLLDNTTKSIGEIAEETGFSNQFHFSRVFKEEFGTCPREYRRLTSHSLSR